MLNQYDKNTFECTLHLPSCDDHGVWRPSYCLTLYRKHSETIKGGLKALSARMGLKSVLADSYGLKILFDHFFLYTAVTVPHNVDPLGGTSQSLPIQRVPRDFLCLTMIVYFVDVCYIILFGVSKIFPNIGFPIRLFCSQRNIQCTLAYIDTIEETTSSSICNTADVASLFLQYH